MLFTLLKTVLVTMLIVALVLTIFFSIIYFSANFIGLSPETKQKIRYMYWGDGNTDWFKALKSALMRVFMTFVGIIIVFYIFLKFIFAVGGQNSRNQSSVKTKALWPRSHYQQSTFKQLTSRAKPSEKINILGKQPALEKQIEDQNKSMKKNQQILDAMRVNISPEAPPEKIEISNISEDRSLSDEHKQNIFLDKLPQKRKEDWEIWFGTRILEIKEEIGRLNTQYSYFKNKYRHPLNLQNYNHGDLIAFMTEAESLKKTHDQYLASINNKMKRIRVQFLAAGLWMKNLQLQMAALTKEYAKIINVLVNPFAPNLQNFQKKDIIINARIILRTSIKVLEKISKNLSAVYAKAKLKIKYIPESQKDEQQKLRELRSKFWKEQ